MSVATETTIQRRCAYCSFTIQPTGHKVLTEYGWAHPLCVIEGSDWSARSW